MILSVNPFDGKLMSYWAINMYSRLPYDNIQTLLEEQEPSLLNRFKIEQSKKALPLIEKNMIKKVCKERVATIHEWVFGTEMYEPSKIMRNFQYEWDQKVTRNWNEDILNKLRQSHTIENNKINGIGSKDKLN